LPPDAYKNARQAPQDLASGRVVAPGEPVLAADLELGHNGDWPTHDQRLVEDGVLVEAILDAELTGDALTQRANELSIKGRSKMTADELRAAIAIAEAEQGAPADSTTSAQEGSS
jgi:hypothetical protein